MGSTDHRAAGMEGGIGSVWGARLHSWAIEQQPWRGGLEPCGEDDYTLSPSNPAHVTGRIPEALQGTLYLCGPGRIRVGGTKFSHWFDGDGMAYALHLDGPNGTARFVCKWVRTSALEQRGGPELEAGEGKGEDTGIRVKGTWTQATAGGLLKNVGLPANPVNTSIIHFAGKLLALCEGGPPFLLDALSLSTLGPYSFPNLALPFFSAHPKLDPATGGEWQAGERRQEGEQQCDMRGELTRGGSRARLAVQLWQCAVRHAAIRNCSRWAEHAHGRTAGLARGGSRASHPPPIPSHPPSPFQNCPNSRSAPTAACPHTPPVPVLSSCPPSPRHTPPELYNFGSVLFGMQPFAIAADGKHTRMGALQGLPEVALVHDCAMSSRFLVFTIPPYAASAADVAQMLAGQQPLGNRLTYDETKPTRVVVVVGKESLSVEVQMDVWPPFSNYHFCNAYEEGDKLHVLLTVLVSRHKLHGSAATSALTGLVMGWRECSRTCMENHGSAATSALCDFHVCVHSFPRPPLARLPSYQDGPRDGLEGVFKDMYGESWQRSNQCSVWELVFDTTTWELLSRRRAMHSEPGTRGPVLGMEFAVVNPAYTSRKSRYLYVLGSMPERDREELWRNGELGDGVWYGGAGVKGEEDGEGEEGAEGEEGEQEGEGEGEEEERKKMAEYGYLNCIQKYDLKTKQVTTHVTPPGCYVNECSFVPNSGTESEDASKEDDGYLATFVYDATRHKSHVVVLDARDVVAPPVAVVHLQSHVPYHFHGTWAGKATML
ncbi:unnamed protein product [Closterium sp. Naga37s-1]|nr:unnamed protein product [Closterium sp. Naga37s-1]